MSGWEKLADDGIVGAVIIGVAWAIAWVRRARRNSPHGREEDNNDHEASDSDTP